MLIVLNQVRFLFFAIFSIVLCSCNNYFGASDGEVSGNAKITLSQTSSADSISDQIIASGTLMIKSVATDLQTEGMNLKEVKAIAESAKDKIHLAGQLAISTDLNLMALSSSGKKYSLNPLSLAGGIVIKTVSSDIVKNDIKSVKKDYKLLGKIAKATSNALKKVNEDEVLSQKMNDTYYQGAITKLTSSTVGMMDDFGVSSDQLQEALGEVTGDLIQNVKALGIIEEETDIAKKVISGLAQGATEIDYDNVSMTDAKNPAAVANSLAFEIYNEETGGNLDASNSEDFAQIVEIILEGAVESMDDSISSAVDSILEVAIVVYDYSANQLSSVVESIDEVYENSGVETPDNIAEMVSSEEVIDEMVDQGVITEAEAEEIESAVETAAETLTTSDETIPESEYALYDSCSSRFSDFYSDREIGTQAGAALSAAQGGTYSCITDEDLLCPLDREFYVFSATWTKNTSKPYLCELNFEYYEDGFNSNTPFIVFFELSITNQDGNYDALFAGDTVTVSADYFFSNENDLQYRFFKSSDCNGSNLTALTGWQTSNSTSFSVSNTDTGGCSFVYAGVRVDDGVNLISSTYGDGLTGRELKVYPSGTSDYFHSFYIELQSGHGGGYDDGPIFREHELGDQVIVSSSYESSGGGTPTFNYSYAKLENCGVANIGLVPNPVNDFMQTANFIDLGGGANAASKTFIPDDGYGCFLLRGLVKNSDNVNAITIDGVGWDSVNYALFSVVETISPIISSITKYKWDGSSYVEVYNTEEAFGIGDKVKYVVDSYDPDSLLEYSIYKDEFCGEGGITELFSWQTSNEFIIDLTSDHLHYGNCIDYKFSVRNDKGVISSSYMQAPIVTNGELPPNYNGGHQFSKDNSTFYSDLWSLINAEGYLTQGDMLYLNLGSYSDPNGDAVTASVYLRDCSYNYTQFSDNGGGLFSVSIPADIDCSLEIYVSLEDDDSISFYDYDGIKTDLFEYLDSFSVPANLPATGPLSFTYSINGVPYNDLSLMPQVNAGDQVDITVSNHNDPDSSPIYYSLIGERYCSYHEKIYFVTEQTSPDLSFTIGPSFDNQDCPWSIKVIIDDKESITNYGDEINGNWINYDYEEWLAGALNVKPEYETSFSSIATKTTSFWIDEYTVNNFEAGQIIDIDYEITESDGNNVSYSIREVSTCTNQATSQSTFANASSLGQNLWDIVSTVTVTQNHIDNCVRFELLLKDNDGVDNLSSDAIDAKYKLFTINKQNSFADVTSIKKNGFNYTEGSTVNASDQFEVSYEISGVPTNEIYEVSTFIEIDCSNISAGLVHQVDWNSSQSPPLTGSMTFTVSDEMDYYINSQNCTGGAKLVVGFHVHNTSYLQQYIKLTSSGQELPNLTSVNYSLDDNASNLNTSSLTAITDAVSHVIRINNFIFGNSNLTLLKLVKRTDCSGTITHDVLSYYGEYTSGVYLYRNGTSDLNCNIYLDVYQRNDNIVNQDSAYDVKTSYHFFGTNP